MIRLDWYRRHHCRLARHLPTVAPIRFVFAKRIFAESIATAWENPRRASIVAAAFWVVSAN